MTAYLSLVVAIIGIFMYAICTNPKMQEIGRLGFFAGLLTFLLQTARIVNIIK